MPFKSTTTHTVVSDERAPRPTGGRRGVLTTDLCRFIGEAKTWKELRQFVDMVSAASAQGRLDDLAAVDLCRVILDKCQQITDLQVKAHSDLLAETILLASDSAELNAEKGIEVYRASELRRLASSSAESLRAVHTVKKEFEGEVIEPDDAIQIPVRALLEDTRDQNTCFACGQSKWWTKDSGERMCQVCHPDPRGRSTGRCRR